MSDSSILERLLDALSCPVEHPVPKEVFSPFEAFNPKVMEVVADVTDPEIRIVRLLNELGYERIRLQEQLRDKANYDDIKKRSDLQYRLACVDLNFNVMGQALSASMLERLGKSMAGVYAVASNGKVVRVQMAPQVSH